MREKCYLPPCPRWESANNGASLDCIGCTSLDCIGGAPGNVVNIILFRNCLNHIFVLVDLTETREALPESIRNALHASRKRVKPIKWRQVAHHVIHAIIGVSTHDLIVISKTIYKELKLIVGKNLACKLHHRHRPKLFISAQARSHYKTQHQMSIRNRLGTQSRQKSCVFYNILCTRFL